ncbi:hypothetical protein M427DRAFT_270721 [Gonapodya prolifera JEL478]|uniref:GYF domain-containing protein n=1 Tax=Gonapodya prolifera (strain JEL478) TaxID=1344416 RepID=A0A139AXM2_GONPJ|nr:hypothetical protein M427DRAFT_270721 [Gonapodya prolifera JEL478]|eukprot:KXS21454.1 hypothetical protein M427DRAFT_270721 [Gonapodya prolifera JEL478]
MDPKGKRPLREIGDEDGGSKRRKVQFATSDVEKPVEEPDDADDDDLELAPKRRRAVRLEGYDSDDDTPALAASIRDEETVKEEDSKSGGQKKSKRVFEAKSKKEVKFMQQEDIEGQEWENAEEEEEYDESGMKIEPFNMDDEMQNGAFDESGMYIRKKDEFEHHDKWLHGTTREDIEKARAAHEKQEADAALEEERSQKLMSKLSIVDLWKVLLMLLKPGENIIRALRRLGSHVPSSTVPAWKRKLEENKRKKEQLAASSGKNASILSSVPDATKEAQERAKSKLDMDAITAIADKMMAMGVLDVYEETFEQIARQLRLKEVVDEFWEPGEGSPAQSVLDAMPELARRFSDVMLFNDN